jgi:hypothetical protein
MLRKSEIVLRNKISFEEDTTLSALKWRKKSVVDEASVLWQRLKHFL